MKLKEEISIENRFGGVIGGVASKDL